MNRVAHARVGDPIPAYPHKAWSPIPPEVKLKDLWQLVGPQVDKHLSGLPLWKVFCVVYFEGLAHGVAAQERITTRAAASIGESAGAEGGKKS